MKIPQWIRESNLIEQVNDPEADKVCWQAYKQLLKGPLTFQTIMKLHKKIMAGRFMHGDRHPEWEGTLRNIDVYAGNRSCPAWHQVPGLLLHWFATWAFADTEESIKQAHVEFERIHPFADGNGRVGRMVMNWQRHQIKLPPADITYFNRWEYYAWFQ